MPLSRRPLSTRPMNYGSSPCRVPRGVLRQRARVVGALEKRINLSGSHSLDLFLSPSSSLFFSFSCQSVAHSETIILTPFLASILACGLVFSTESLPSALCDQPQPATRGLLAGKEDLMDLPVDCPQRSFQGCLWHRCRRLDGMPSIGAAEEAGPWSSSLALEKLGELSGWLSA